MYVRPKVVLLDVDGVVYRNQKVLQKVSHNIVRYISKELKVSIPEADAMNQVLYKNFGHSYIGMRSIFNTSHSIHHFNNYVYDDDLLNDVSTVHDDTLPQDAASVRFLIQECKRRDIDVYLFSNAPLKWCETIIRTMKLSNYVNDQQIITCDHDVFRMCLKPNPYVYDTMLRYLCHKKHDEVDCLFVDDSLVNLVPLLGCPQWQPVFFDNTLSTRLKSTKLSTVHNLQEVHSLL